MREILFRGKRIDNGEWITGDLLQYKDSVVIHTYVDGFRTAFEVDPDTVGQYTGLTDKNGKKIFEGDFVIRQIRKAPTIDPESLRPHGRWEKVWGSWRNKQCNCCSAVFTFDVTMNYCPNCGAKMEVQKNAQEK